MMNELQATTICEKLYKLRDAVASDDLHYALYLTRDVYEKIESLIYRKEKKDCNLNCEIKENNATI